MNTLIDDINVVITKRVDLAPEDFSAISLSTWTSPKRDTRVIEATAIYSWTPTLGWTFDSGQFRYQHFRKDGEPYNQRPQAWHFYRSRHEDHPLNAIIDRLTPTETITLEVTP